MWVTRRKPHWCILALDHGIDAETVRQHYPRLTEIA